MRHGVGGKSAGKGGGGHCASRDRRGGGAAGAAAAAAAEIVGRGAGEPVVLLLAGPAGSMQNVINTVKGKALEVAEYLTPVLKVPVRAGAWRRGRGAGRGGARRLRRWSRYRSGDAPALFAAGRPRNPQPPGSRVPTERPRPLPHPIRGVARSAAAARPLAAPYRGSRLRGRFSLPPRWGVRGGRESLRLPGSRAVAAASFVVRVRGTPSLRWL